MANDHFKYLIAGQGIAGTVLARKMSLLGLDFCIVDQPEENNCSTVAAGLCNPVTGRNYSLTWKAGELWKLFPYFYALWEKDLEVSFWHPMPLFRLGYSIAESNTIEARKSDASIQSFLMDEHLPPSQFLREASSFLCLKGGYVDAPVLLKTQRNQWEKEGKFRYGKVVQDDLQINNDSIAWQGESFAGVIWCTGYRAIEFDLPIVPNRGLIADIDVNEDLSSIAIAKGWIIPIGSKRVRFGSTYAPAKTDLSYTKKEQDQLEDKIYKSLVEGIYEIQSIKAGIRPTVPDRKPLLGRLRNKPLQYLFGGLGSKGFSMAPYLADVFLEYLLQGRPLPCEVDASRYDDKS